MNEITLLRIKEVSTKGLPMLVEGQYLDRYTAQRILDLQSVLKDFSKRTVSDLVLEARRSNTGILEEEKKKKHLVEDNEFKDNIFTYFNKLFSALKEAGKWLDVLEDGADKYDASLSSLETYQREVELEIREINNLQYSLKQLIKSAQASKRRLTIDISNFEGDKKRLQKKECKYFSGNKTITEQSDINDVMHDSSELINNLLFARSSLESLISNIADLDDSKDGLKNIKVSALEDLDNEIAKVMKKTNDIVRDLKSEIKK